MTTYDEAGDLEPHVGAEFRQAFPTWAALRGEVADRARYPEFDTDRAVRQILMADFLTRLSRDEVWIVQGSLGLPARPPRDMDWPADFRVPGVTGVDQAHLLARAAFDIDLYAPGIDTRTRTAPDPAAAYGAAADAAVRAACAPADRPSDPAGRGLGGLVHYRPGELVVRPGGKVTGTVIAQPVDPRFPDVRPVDDPVAIEVDISPGSGQQFTSPPDRGERPLVALDLPGFEPTRPLLYPLADYLADKIALLTGPPISHRPLPAGPWHRYKDLFDLHFVLRTCRIEPHRVRTAIATNRNWRRLPAGLPRPYRLYGQPPHQPGEPAVPWHEGVEKLRASSPQLARYPSFAAMSTGIATYVDTVAASPSPHRGELGPGRQPGPPGGATLAPY